MINRIKRMSSRLIDRLPNIKKVGATDNQVSSSNRDNISVEHDSDVPQRSAVTGSFFSSQISNIEEIGKDIGKKFDDIGEAVKNIEWPFISGSNQKDQNDAEANQAASAAKNTNSNNEANTTNQKIVSDKPRDRGIAGMLIRVITWPFALLGKIVKLPFTVVRKIIVGIISRKSKQVAARVVDTAKSNVADTANASVVNTEKASVAIDENAHVNNKENNAENKNFRQKASEEINDIIHNSFIGKLYYWDPVKWPRRLGRTIILLFFGLNLGIFMIILPAKVSIPRICGFVILQNTKFCEIACNLHVDIKCEKHEPFTTSNSQEDSK